MNAYKHLIKHALADSEYNFINVFDGERWVACRRSYTNAVNAVESVEDCTINVRQRSGNPEPGKKAVLLGSFYVIQDVGSDEHVADFGVTDWADAWWNKFQRENS